MAKYQSSWFLSILVLVLYSTTPVDLGCVNFGNSRFIVCQDLSSRGLEKIPGNIQRNVTNLNLDRNSIKILTSGALKGLERLLQIHLGYNSISEIQEGAFEGIPSKITSLLLKKNKLTKLEAKMWTGLKEIVYLDIQKNELTTISHNCFGQDLRVIKLNLDQNKILHFDTDTLKPMLNGLEFLSLHGNQLDWVPCLRHDNDSKIAGKPGQKRKVLKMLFTANPLRCQPCSCWAPVHHRFDCESPWGRSESNDKPDHVCRDFPSVLYPHRAHMQCCKVIEAEPNATCLSNPAAFEHKEKNPKPMKSKTQTPKPKPNPEKYFTKKTPTSRCMLIGKQVMKLGRMEEEGNAAFNNESNNSQTGNAIKPHMLKSTDRQILMNAGLQNTIAAEVIFYNILLAFQTMIHMGTSLC